MHFIVGGAFNGKSKWVKKQYGDKVKEWDWRSAYSPSFERKKFEQRTTSADCIVLEGIEHYIKASLTYNVNPGSLRNRFNEQLSLWLDWENAAENRTLIIIGNDVTKGIIPIEKEDRLWSDITGWCYQDLTAQADRVDVIWYGIAKRLK